MRENIGSLEAFEIADRLVGPFDMGGEGIEPWQRAYYEVARGAIAQLIGERQVPDGWMPEPDQWIRLYDNLKHERRQHGMVRSLKLYVTDRPAGAAISRFRDNQHEITRALADACGGVGLQEPLSIKSPTGSGKTAVIVGLAEGFRYSRAQGRDRKISQRDGIGVLILAHQLDILTNTMNSFREFSTTITPTLYYGKAKDLSKVTIMSYQSFNAAYKNGQLPRDFFDVVIRDEAHHAYGDETGRNLFAFCYSGRGDHPLLAIDFSATPTTDGEREYEKSVVWGINQGILSPVMAREVRAHVMHEGGWIDRNSLIDDPLYNRQVVDEILSGLADGRRAVVRCLRGDDLRHQEVVKQLLMAQGPVRVRNPYTGKEETRAVNAMAIRGDMPKDFREGIYRIFRDYRRPLDVLLFVGTIVEGWDGPIAKKLINAAPTQSDVLAEQLLGRIMRLYNRWNGEPVYAEAVDFVHPHMPDQVTSARILTRDGPRGMRYRQGAIIGPGLVDLRPSSGGARSAYEEYAV